MSMGPQSSALRASATWQAALGQRPSRSAGWRAARGSPASPPRGGAPALGLKQDRASPEGLRRLLQAEASVARRPGGRLAP